MDYVIRTAEQMPVLLRGFRQTHALTQKELAARLGITQQALSQLENDPQSASFERVMALLAALQVVVVLRDSRKTKPSTQAW